MDRRRTFAVAAVAALGWLAIGGTASAQTIALPIPAWPSGALEPAAVGPEGDTVLTRPRPDYDPLGIRAGSFLFYPSIGLSETYDSNVFATPGNSPANFAPGDWYTTISPAFSLTSDWSQHALGIQMSADSKHYAHFTTENVDNFSASAQGRYDIANGQYLLAQSLYQLNHEDRSSVNTPGNAKEPIEYHLTGGNIAYVHQPGRLGLRVDTTVTSWDFNNGSAASTGGGFNANQTIPQDFRDRIEYVLAPRLTYEIQPGYNAFVRAIGNERQYFSQEPGAGPNGENVRRNSHGWEIDGGTAIAITSIMTGEIYAGYQQQDYENPLLKSDSGVAFGGNLIWNVTQLTTVRGSFSQSIAETTLQGASSSSETGVGFTVEHELLRNLLLLGSGGYTRDDYQGVSRVDDTYGANVGARYLLNRNWKATFDLTYSKRNSTAPDSDYERVIGTFGISLGF